MKKLFCSLVFLLPIALWAQSDQSTGTTLEEYRYMAKGYAYQASMGLDPFKEGYEVKALAESKNNVEILGLFKESTSQPQAILLIINSKSVEPNYICLPNNQADQRVWDLYELDRQAITDPAIWDAYDSAMRDFTFQLMGNAPTVNQRPTEYADSSPITKNDMEDEDFEEQSDLKDEKQTDDKWTAKGDAPITNKKPRTKKVVTKSNEAVNPHVVITLDENLADIGVIDAPVIRGNYPAKGILVVKFCVNGKGEVVNARYTMRGSTTWHEQLKQMALESVQNSTFAASSNSEQCGTATFHFK